jgi:hypothetical protein
VEDDDAAGPYEKTQVKIADTYFQRSCFGRVLDNHYGNGTEPYAEYKDSG